jgi:hypothetical protein
MGLFDGVTTAIAEPIIARIVVNEITRFAGPEGKGLVIAICLNKDIFQLWVDNGAQEGVAYGLDEARMWAQKAPKAHALLTAVNVKKWLCKNDCQHLVAVIERTSGGDAWLEWTVRRFREGLWK